MSKTVRTHIVRKSERGMISIMTAIFYILLVAVVTVSFTQLMLQEQRQTLDDELTKSAYNAAQAGVEDAKRAIVYCSTLTGNTQTTCNNDLHTQTCPGFFAQSTFVGNTNMLIPGYDTLTRRVSVSNDTNQGYSCVTVSDDSPELTGKLDASSGSVGYLQELRANQPYTSIIVKWHRFQDDGQTVSLPAANTFTGGGSPRLSDWGVNWPAALKVTLISINVDEPSPFQLSNIALKSFYLYPVSGGAGSTTTIDTGSVQRQMTTCGTALASEYSCAMTISFTGGGLNESSPSRQSRRFIALQPLYRNTSFSIAPGASGPKFQGVQQVIDSTGYAGGVYRRVQTKVRVGSQPSVPAAAIDSALGFCKSFRVGADAAAFDNSECN